ncbi:phosphopantetheine-binding protein [Streptomyces sp. ISID311]|uniref:phosphopantetheine-binding protein n=1 Tax=Streptomyces sp. ISID311 TaxID=2601673 RepID=UPI00164B96C8|nr:phosphopantetheine-binding protein [Streptomyces sp. ISID311]
MSNDVEAVLHRHILGVLTDLGADDIRPERSLNDLGANSLDRIDILSGALEELQVDLRPEELREAMDLRQLAALLQKCTAP